MKPLTAAVEEYKSLLSKSENLAVINLFYDDDIVQVENNEAPVKGKNAVLEQELRSIESVHWFNQRITSLVVDEKSGLVMGEMQVEFKSKKLGLKRLEEAFVQQWKENKIIYQRFYYKEFIDCNE